MPWIFETLLTSLLFLYCALSLSSAHGFLANYHTLLKDLNL